MGRLIAVVLVVVLILGIGLACVVQIPTGHTGVLTTFGRVENYTLDSGMHFKAPWQKVIKMDNRIQKHSVSLGAFSSDIQEVNITYTINYQISKSDAMTIYSTIGTDYFNTVITPNISEAVKVSTAKYTAESLVNDRSRLASDIETYLTDLLNQYHIEVVGTSIEDIDFTDAFTNAVEAKQVAQQEKLRAQTVAEQQVIEAEAQAQVRKVEAEAAGAAKRIEAEAAAEAKRIAAEAEAYEIEVKASAEAEANRKLAESITDTLIDYTYAQSWDGKYPTYVGGDNAFLDLR